MPSRRIYENLFDPATSPEALIKQITSYEWGRAAREECHETDRRDWRVRTCHQVDASCLGNFWLLLQQPNAYGDL